MPNAVVISAVKSLAANAELLSDFKTDLLARAYLKIWLFNTNTPIAPNTALGSLSPCVYSGYAPITVSALDGPGQDPSQNTFLVTSLAYFAGNGGGVVDQVYSSALVSAIPGSTAATGTVTTTGGVVSAPVIVGGGSGYVSAPNVTVLGGGTGAVITATITAGVVTSMTLVSGGTGYTAATIVIDPPLEIVAGGPLPSPVQMGPLLSALPILQQINLPAGT